MKATVSVFIRLALSFILAAGASAATPPNVIIIFIDDMGYGDIGPFGATKQKSPHLDLMGAEGMKLTSITQLKFTTP